MVRFPLAASAAAAAVRPRQSLAAAFASPASQIKRLLDFVYRKLVNDGHSVKTLRAFYHYREVAGQDDPVQFQSLWNCAGLLAVYLTVC